MNPAEPSTSQAVPPARDPEKGILFIAVSQFGVAFSFNCIMSFMPFYILKISEYGTKETMLWIGLIMGISPLVTAAAAPFWGSLTTRIRPKLLYQAGTFFNGVIFLLMGFAGSLPLLLFLRLCQGFLGGISTIGLILIASSSSEKRLHRHMSLFQNAITAGQLIGPPLGAYAVALFGYRSPFLIAFVVVILALVFCHYYVWDTPVQPEGGKQSRPGTGGIVWGWALGIVGTIHLTFLPSILPHILEGFQLTEEAAITTAGEIMMAYTATAILGNYLMAAFSGRVSLARLIAISCLSAAVLQSMLYLSSGIYSFTAIRMLQTGMIAALFPLVITTFARDARGSTLGFLNSARFVGNSLGPLLATSIVAQFDLLTLYLTISGLTLAVLCVFLATLRK
ncbi:MAG TPA: MFS transporter [Syntrophales bacterium]|nr:MFS transporter [Syntrophales bacterium]